MTSERMPTVQLYVFHVAMCCDSCGAAHQPGEVTHAVCWPNVTIPICNACHTAQWTWEPAEGMRHGESEPTE